MGFVEESSFVMSHKIRYKLQFNYYIPSWLKGLHNVYDVKRILHVQEIAQNGKHILVRALAFLVDALDVVNINK